jgi:hypothetical protein
MTDEREQCIFYIIDGDFSRFFSALHEISVGMQQGQKRCYSNKIDNLKSHQVVCFLIMKFQLYSISLCTQDSPLRNVCMFDVPTHSAHSPTF